MTRRVLKSKRGRQDDTNVSLFPFLAVLICTMGALILLLVVISRQARLQAAETAETAASEIADESDDLSAEREMAQWRIEQLKNSHRQTESQLAEARLALGHVEDHARRLRDQLEQLQATYSELNLSGDLGSRQRSQWEAELKRLRAEIAETQRQLAETEKAARRRSYAVLPYRGPHDTFRRPIYIECAAHTITVQPEGIVLTEQDFNGPMGPGNPLAAALRAAREYLLTHGDIDPQQSGEPYPLLLIRPDGIGAYYAARSAMKSWGSEFGYELIGEDWELEFQRPDAQLAQVVRRAVDTARVRQARLIMAAPRPYRRATRPQYRASPTRGGAVRHGRSSGGGFSAFRPRHASGGFGGPDEPATGSRPNQTPRYQDAGHGPAGHGPAGHGGAEREDKPSQGTFAVGPPRESTHSAENPGGAARRPGEWQPEAESPADGSPAGQPGRHAASLARTRGRDWALPDAARGSVPITRPIRIDCYADHLAIVPERGLGGGKSIPLGPRLEESIDEFRSAIWEHMNSWGIAGEAMYWRPVLNVYVAPNAEQRFTELDALLEDSGLTVKRK